MTIRDISLLNHEKNLNRALKIKRTDLPDVAFKRSRNPSTEVRKAQETLAKHLRSGFIENVEWEEGQLFITYPT